MTKAANDYSEIARRMREIGSGNGECKICEGRGKRGIWVGSIECGLYEYEPCPECTTCSSCEGGGWTHYGTGSGDPHFRECDDCHNPQGRPSP